MKTIALFDKVSRYSLYALAFLLPLWFLPFTQNVTNFPKQALLAVLLFVGVVAWLAKALNQGEILFRRSLVHGAVLVLVFATLLSTLFSVSRYGSFWGWPLDVGDGFLTLLLFALLSFFIASSVQGSSALFPLLFSLVLSGTLGGLFTVLHLYQVFPLPFAFAKAVTFNTIGSVNSVAVLAAALLPLALTLAFGAKVLLRWILWGLSALLLAVLLLINFSDSWIALGAGLLVLLAFGMWNLRKRAEFGWVSFPMALLIVALFFLVFRVSLPGAPATPLEVSLRPGTEIQILKESFKERLLVGSGPATFAYTYTKHKPEDLNQTVFWGTRFGSGAAEILDWFVTKGILGGAALLLLLLAVAFVGVKGLSGAITDNFTWMLGLGSFASLAGAGVALFLYPFNPTLWFAFWVLLGSLVVALFPEARKISIAPPSFLAVAGSFVFLLVLIFGLGLLFVGGQKYVAEVRYFQGVRHSLRGELDNTIANLLKAAQLNPSVDIYWRDLAQLYLQQVNVVSADTSLKEEERRQRVQAAVNNAVTAARQAVTVDRTNVANWNVQGFVYRNLIAVPGAADQVTASYEKAIELEPASPFSWTELARAYILHAQTLANQKGMEEKRKEAFDLALEKLEKAIALKSDYAPAHYLTAVTFEQQGKAEEAVKKLEETKNVAPQDIGLAFQLGVAYWQRNELGKAKAELDRALALNENYSNARYILGLVYDKQGERDKAIEQFAKIQELNPDNEEIKKILGNLKEGKPALEGITPSQPPIGENPPEIQKSK